VNEFRYPEARAERASKDDGHGKSDTADTPHDVPISGLTEIDCASAASFEACPSGEHLRMTDTSQSKLPMVFIPSSGDATPALRWGSLEG
jgi:hypothetical protein